MTPYNLWKTTGEKTTDDINIIRYWLCDKTNGETYPLTNYILDFNVNEIFNKGYDYEFPETAFDKIVGFKHDYTVDDPNLTKIACTIYEGLLKLNEEVRNHPENFFLKRDVKFYCKCHEGISCDYCLGTENQCIYKKSCPFKTNG